MGEKNDYSAASDNIVKPSFLHFAQSTNLLNSNSVSLFDTIFSYIHVNTKPIFVE